MLKVLMSAGLLVGVATSVASAADYYARYAPEPRTRALCVINQTALVLSCPPQIVAPADAAFELRQSYLELSADDRRRPYVQTYTWSR